MTPSPFMKLSFWSAAIIALTLVGYGTALTHGAGPRRAAAIAVGFMACISFFSAVIALAARDLAGSFAATTALFIALSAVYAGTASGIIDGIGAMFATIALVTFGGAELGMKLRWSVPVLVLTAVIIAVTIAMPPSLTAIVVATVLAACGFIVVGIIGRDRAMKPRTA